MRLLFALFLISNVSLAANLKFSEVANIGDSVNSGNPGHTVANYSNLPAQKCLVAGANPGGGLPSYYGFYSMNSPISQSQYEVPAGKNFYATSFSAIGQSAGFVQTGYGMGPIATEGTLTAPLTPIYFSSGANTDQVIIYLPVVNTYYTRHALQVFPAGSFPFMRYSIASNYFSGVLCGVLQ